MNEADGVLDPQRVIDDLKELRRRTADASGAHRVAWTETWLDARAFLRERLADLPVNVDQDEAGNIWARLPGATPETVVLGSHLDSVPDGGWLDGAFGVMAGLEVVRALAAERESLPCSVALVDWADEEGARFGRSLFGSSAVAGSLDVPAARDLMDADGSRLPDVLAEHGIDLDKILDAGSRLEGVLAYLEAHIEQGPVLESEGLPIGVVQGTVGIERHRVVVRGQSAHAGSTPMDRRRDPLLAAARTALAVRDAAVRHEGVGTVGSMVTTPGIVTAIPEEAAILVDQRHLDAGELAAMLAEAKRAADEACAAEGVTAAWDRIVSIAPRPFDHRLISIAREVCRELCGHDRLLPSGPLHDATEMAARVPTAMVFSSSRSGLSHNRAEDTPEEHLRLAVTAFHRTVRRALVTLTG